jgi:hypothetical protein
VLLSASSPAPRTSPLRHRRQAEGSHRKLPPFYHATCRHVWQWLCTEPMSIPTVWLVTRHVFVAENCTLVVFVTHETSQPHSTRRDICEQVHAHINTSLTTNNMC